VKIVRKDMMRGTKCLNDSGYKVIRFWNNDVLGNLEGFCK